MGVLPTDLIHIFATAYLRLLAGVSLGSPDTGHSGAVRESPDYHRNPFLPLDYSRRVIADVPRQIAITLTPARS